MNGLCKRLVLAGMVLVGADICLADGVIRDGLGARSGGRGGTNLAFEDNGEILLDNPASMGRVNGNGLAEIGVDMLFPDLTYSNSNNGSTRSWDNPFPAGQASYIRRSEDGRWAYGLGAYSVAGFGANYTLNGPSQVLPDPQHYHSLGMFVKVLPGVSYNVTDKLSIGGTFGLGLSHAELAGPYFLQAPGPFQGTPTFMNLQATGVAPTWSVGLRYDVDDSTSIGATYTSQTDFHMAGPANVAVPGLGESHYDANLQMVWPQSIGVGVKHKLCPHRIISADFIWYDWSSAYNQFNLDLTNFSNPVFAGLLGSSLHEIFPLSWRDSVSVRLGHEWLLDDDHIIRVGYIYHRNPIPPGTLTPWLQATLENAFTLGYGWNYSKCTSFDLGYQYSFGPSVDVGTSNFVGGDFNNAHSTSQVHWVYASVIQKF